MIYFDTAYLARCYVEDPGYEQVRELAEKNPVACCELGRVELLAVLHRKRRERALSQVAFDEVLGQFDDDEQIGLWSWLPLSHAIFDRAAGGFRRLSERIYLRSADAIHLTCARESGFDTVFTNDRHMLRAASSFGIEGIDVIVEANGE